nr:nicotinamide riboside transporter PnuC [Sphingomonas bacterium]
MSAIEWIATALGLVCVALGARRSVWTFPTAIGSVTLFGWVVWRQRLYSDAALQLFFAAANLYGWANWRRSRARAGEVLVTRAAAGDWWAWGAAAIVATALWGGAMARWTDAAYPWWDAGTAVVSMVAQVWMARRRLENWWLWVAVDVALIPLYLVKHLPLFAALYAIYLALSVWGLVDWRRAVRPMGPAVA